VDWLIDLFARDVWLLFIGTVLAVSTAVPVSWWFARRAWEDALKLQSWVREDTRRENQATITLLLQALELGIAQGEDVEVIWDPHGAKVVRHARGVVQPGVIRAGGNIVTGSDDSEKGAGRE